MNIVNVLKHPLTDISSCVNIYKEIKADRISFEKKEFNLATLENRNKANKIKLTTHAAPLASAGMMLLAFGSMDVWESYQSGKPFIDAMGGSISDLLTSMSDMATNSFSENPLSGKNFMDELMSQPADLIKDYSKYVAEGVATLFSTLIERSINTALILSTMGVYAAAKAATKALGFVSGEAADLSKVRFYESEDFKLKILRKHHQDSVFDNLNDEELFAMSYSFNEVLSKNNQGQRKVMRFMLEKIETFDFAIKTFRKAFNSSHNETPKLMTQVFKFLEDDIEPSLSSTFKRYGVDEIEFNTVSSNKYGHLSLPKDVEKKAYIFNVNKRAIMAAYKRKLRDDMLLAYSLRLEGLTTGSVNINDKELLSDFGNFVKFIELYEHGDKIFEGSKLDPALKTMKKQASVIIGQTPSALSYIMKDKNNKNYINFLEANAPHLVERKNENKVYLNNFSFISYFEAERERYARRDALEERLRESLVSMSEKSNLNNNIDYKKQQGKVVKIQEELISLSSVFFKQDSIVGKKNKDMFSSIMNIEKSKISSIYNDKEIGVEVSVRNFLTSKEKELLLRGDALKERGMNEETARRIAKVRIDIDSKTKDYNDAISRRSFKERSKRFRK